MAAVNRILVAIDFGENSTRVVEFGRTLADALGSSLHLLHVIGYPLIDGAARDSHYAEATARLNAFVPQAGPGGKPITTACVFGTPAPEIARYAENHAIDLIVMGTHSHGPNFQMFTGSVADAVNGMTRCAVLTVKAPRPLPYSHTFDPGVVAQQT